jgi:hypothetical protein
MDASGYAFIPIERTHPSSPRTHYIRPNFIIRISTERNRTKLIFLCISKTIFGPKRDEVTEGWRKLHNENLHNLYLSPNTIRMIKSRKMIWAGHVAQMEKRNAYRILVGKPERKRPVGRPRHRWVNNIKIGLKDIGWDGTDWIDLAQDGD